MEKTHWAAAEYFQSGQYTALALTELLPIQKSPEPANYYLGFDAMAVPDVVAWFMFGMTGDNNLTEIEACFNGSTEMYNHLNVAIADFKKGGTDYILQGVAELSIAAL